VLLSVKGCTNVPSRFRNAASAVDLHEACVVVFDGLNCRGRRVVLQPYHKKYTDNLETIGFNNAINSVRPCGPKSKQKFTYMYILLTPISIFNWAKHMYLHVVSTYL